MKKSRLQKNYKDLVLFSNNFALYKLCFFNIFYYLKTGHIIFIKYLDNSVFLKTRFFIGLCFGLSNSKSFSYFGLRNNLNKDYIELIFSLYSPFILDLKNIKKYTKKFRLSKLYFKEYNSSPFYN